MLSPKVQSINASNLENVSILNRVRLIAINGQLALIVFAIWYLDIKLPLTWLLGLLALEIIFELYCYRIVAKQRRVSSSELFIHIVIDSLALAGLVYFSGGANNPFIYLLLLSVALGSFMLAPRYLLMVTALQLALYSLLNIYQRPLELGESSPLSSFHLHLAGMWVNFILTVILIAIFGLLTRYAMLKQEKKMQSLREKHLQDEQILGLGIMSASAAHELGTPLSTMAIIVDDLKHMELSKDLQNDMQLLATEITNCKNIIGALSDKSRDAQQQLIEQENAEQQSSQLNFKQRLEGIIEQWLVYRPQIKLEQQWQQAVSPIKQNISISLEQAITNLFDNAADASLANGNDQLQLSVAIEQHQIIIEIVDFGCGILADVKESLGVRIQPTKKQDGLGWGMLLSNVSIERAGGKVQLLVSNSGGTLTRIFLPEVVNS
jgi:two-component system sensor histidine kinase RegB